MKKSKKPWFFSYGAMCKLASSSRCHKNIAICHNEHAEPSEYPQTQTSKSPFHSKQNGKAKRIKSQNVNDQDFSNDCWSQAVDGTKIIVMTYIEISYSQ